MAAPTSHAAALQIEVDDVDVRFATPDGELAALGGMSLSVAAGSFVVIIGPNGCGKSTLLRVIAGLIGPTRGAVTVGGEPPRPGDGRVGVAFQQPRLVPWRSLTDNVALPLEVAGVGVAERRERAMVALERVGLRGVGRLRPRELSGGMAQRAGLARALIADPSVLLLDEPFSALDALTRETFDAELERLWLDRPRTIVLVTHSVSEAVMLADRVVVMTPRPGRVLRTVDVDAARPRPTDPAGKPDAADASADIRRALADAHAEELRPWVEQEDAA